MNKPISNDRTPIQTMTRKKRLYIEVCFLTGKCIHRRGTLIKKCDCVDMELSAKSHKLITKGLACLVYTDVDLSFLR